MIDKFIILLLGKNKDLISKRLTAFLLNKFTLLVSPFLLQYGVHVQLDDNIILAIITGLVVNTLGYVAGETIKPSNKKK